MVQYINKAAWQDAILKEEILEEIADGGVSVSVAWEDVEDKPEVIAAGATAAEARTAIGAGTSNLVIGTTGTTAMAGNATPEPANASVTNAKVATDAAIALSKLANVAAYAAGGITAGTLQSTLNSLADRITALENL